MTNGWLIHSILYYISKQCVTNCCRSCTLNGRIVSLRQDATHLHYRVIWPEKLSKCQGSRETQVDDTEALLRHYLSLKVDLGSLYKQWSASDPNFRKRAPQFTGVRILTQDAWETLVSFICSSNNNISRISQMVSTEICRYMSSGSVTNVCVGPQTLCSVWASYRSYRRCAFPCLS